MDLADLVFPRKCLECKKSGLYICSSCLNKVRIPPQICVGCKRLSFDGRTHVNCRRPLGLEKTTSLWIYEKVIRQALLKLKYRFALDIASELVDHMGHQINKNKPPFPKNCLLVSIPLHRQRRKWRGFNQAEEIGRLFASRLEWEFYPDVLIRKKSTRPQTELRGEDRRKNIIGAFALNRNYQPLITSHRPLIIFDDVYTTGATIKEAAKVLKRNRAKKVWGLTIAR